MLQRQACLLSEPAWRWLRESQEVRVLAVFERACNLVNEKGQLLSLVAPELGMGPFALMVEMENGRFTNWITRDPTVTIQADKGYLQVGSLLLHWANAPRWQPRPAWESVCAAPLSQHLPPLRQLLIAAAPKESLSALLFDDPPVASGPIAVHLLRTAVPFIRLLQYGLNSGEVAACEKAVQGLAGLGGGLTPAGDDFLVGAIYALWACSPAEQAALWAGIIVETAVHRTTTLSAAWLTAAGQGQAGSAWHNLIDALILGHKERIQQAALAVLATGHTSGADGLTGFLVTAVCLTDRLL
jgi:hypothetical protein